MLVNGRKNKLKTVYLDSIRGVDTAADALAGGEIVVVDYGATFGTTFLPFLRKRVAQVRKETEPLATVSLVMTHSQVMRWIDFDTIHPKLKSLIEAGHLDTLEGVSFIRFPASTIAKQLAGEYHVNSLGEIQAFLVPESDKLMRRLRERHNIHYVGVRSANIHGDPEEFNYSGAHDYAEQIGAKVIAVQSRNYNNIHLMRQRVGSQPIIQFNYQATEEMFEITLVRAGNTHPDTMRRLLTNFVSAGGNFKHQEEKVGPLRKWYDSPLNLEDPRLLREHLLQVSGLR